MHTKVLRGPRSLAVFLVLLLTGCAVRVGTPAGEKPKPITTWENVHVVNGEVALFNNALVKAVIAANDVGALETEYARTLLDVQEQINGWQHDLTPSLATLQSAIKDKAKIKDLTDKLADAANSRLQAGGAGIKNPQAAAEVTAIVNSLRSSISSLLGLLTSQGVR